MGIAYEISVVSPVYGCNECLSSLYLRLKDTLSKITDSFEIIFVNDACPQNSWDTIVDLCKNDPRVKGINLSRNFGQHHAITAGLDHAQGQWVVVMDCDLQDQPEEIIKLYEKAKEGYDLVVGQRILRNDSFIKRMLSKAFYATLRYFTDMEHDASSANFGIYSHKVIQSVNLYKEQIRAFPLLTNLVGFKRTSIPIEHGKRETGKSAYTFKKMFELAFNCIIVHSNKPLRLSIKFGMLISLFSVCYMSWLIAKYFLFDVPVAGWTSTMVVLLFMFGLMFAVLGTLGVYIGKIFDEVKERPLYLMQDKINF